MEMVQFVNNRLYGKYFPVKESEEYLKEHYMFFKEMVWHEVRLLEIFFQAYDQQRKKYLKPTTTFLGYPKYGNILENKEKKIRDIERKLEPSIQQMQNLENILYKPVSEISIEDINFVYEFRYKRRRKEFVKFAFAAIIVILYVCILP